MANISSRGIFEVKGFVTVYLRLKMTGKKGMRGEESDRWQEGFQCQALGSDGLLAPNLFPFGCLSFGHLAVGVEAPVDVNIVWIG